MTHPFHKLRFFSYAILLILTVLMLGPLAPSLAGDGISGGGAGGSGAIVVSSVYTGPYWQAESITAPKDLGVVPLRIWITNPGDITGGSLKLNYDPEVLEPVSLEDPTKLKADPGDFAGLAAAFMTSGPGQIGIIAAGETPTTAEDALLCTVYFKLLAGGSSQLLISDSHAYTKQGIEIPINVINEASIKVIPYHVEKPVATPNYRDFVNRFNVELACPTAGADIYYTVNNETPDSSSQKYIPGSPIYIEKTTTLKAIAIKDGVNSEIASYTFSKSDQCFIATASYGSKFTPAVVCLRQFRDHYLLTNAPGRAFVDFYYHSSPPIAAYIASREPLKLLVRVMLTPLVGVAYLLLHPRLLYLVMGSVIMGLLIIKRKKAIEIEPL